MSVVDLLKPPSGLKVLVTGSAAGIGAAIAKAFHEAEARIYFLRRAVPKLKGSTRSPNIISMSSVAGRLGYALRTPYASTKWAIIGMMKSLAIELGPDDVRVNAILPGVVAGPRMSRVIGARAQELGIAFEDMEKTYLQKISLRRMVTEVDVAAMCLLLSSPAARNITGQAISVDGNVEYLWAGRAMRSARSPARLRFPAEPPRPAQPTSASRRGSPGPAGSPPPEGSRAACGFLFLRR